MRLQFDNVARRGLRLRILAILSGSSALAQANSYERAFPQSKAAVEKALEALQSSLAGHLPVLDGFAKPGEHPLDRYQRGYYQSTLQVTSTPAGGSLVRITTKVTAWYADPGSAHSGYQLLTSNGRLEADLLDQLAEQLAKVHSGTSTPSATAPVLKAVLGTGSLGAVPRPFLETDQTFASSLSQGLAAQQHTSAKPADSLSDEKSRSALQGRS